MKPESLRSGGGAGGPRSGAAQALGHVGVGQLNLAVGRAGVGELVPGVGVFQVPPQTRHLRREIVVAVFLGHDLDHMELGQQVAVGQGQLIPIQELASRHLVIILSGAGVNLLWQRRVQIVVQLLQRLGQASLKSSVALLLRIFDVGGELGEDIDARCVGFPVFRRQSGVLLRGQSLLQELLDLIHVRLHIPVEGQERRVCAGGEVVQVSGLPFQIHSGDIEHDAFQPEDHKETLGEGTVANAFPIDSSLHEELDLGVPVVPVSRRRVRHAVGARGQRPGPGRRHLCGARASAPAPVAVAAAAPRGPLRSHVYLSSFFNLFFQPGRAVPERSVSWRSHGKERSQAGTEDQGERWA
uniref:Chloride intracellular channel protein 5 n=1 Tax=Sus scrofa TaxID=9823 RepID=A0A480J3Z9_PIG